MYLIEWQLQNGDKGARNVSVDECSLKVNFIRFIINSAVSFNSKSEISSFQLPGITTEDKFSVSIRAIGNTGIGIPHFLNLSNFTARQRRYTDTILAVALGSLLCVVFIILCATIIYCHRRRAKARRRQQRREQQVHEQQQLRGNQQMMNGMDYAAGLMNSSGGSYHFDVMPNGDAHGQMGNGVLCTYDGVTTILPSPSTDPHLTFLQPSVVREEILAGSVPTIINQHHRNGLDLDGGDAHELQTLISVPGNGETSLDCQMLNGHVVVVPNNMTMSTGLSEETMSVPSSSSSSSSSASDSVGDQSPLNGHNNNNIINNAADDDLEDELSSAEHLASSTPTKGPRRDDNDDCKLPLVGDLFHLPKPQTPPFVFFTNNNNNPKLLNKNVIPMKNGTGTGKGQVPVVVYSTINKNNGKMAVNGLGRAGDKSPTNDDGRIVQENGYAEEEDDSRLGLLLLNGSGVSSVGDEVSTEEERRGGVAVVGGGAKGSNSLGSNYNHSTWLDTFRRPIVGPNG